MNLKHDKEITIAIGKSRKETKWKNQKMLWSELLDKISTTVRTKETQVEYKKMSKAEQDEIKDVGGFVGGTLKEGRRKAENVIDRSLLTLDIDYAPVGLWDTIEVLSDYACAVYSTHKSTLEAPRLRLLIPLNRNVTPDEYEAIARKVADDIGIDYFDDTTYQPSRLMYWASTSLDGDYVFKYLDEKWLDVDKILATYKDWRDTSFWAESSRVKDIIRKQASKQGDPEEKQGLIGAFCKTYRIPEAIEAFIPDVYVKCEIQDRYTYINGSTAAGLVLYDNGKFAYSNHATDPTSGKLCNAFDLVRIHKFGELDEDEAFDTSTTNLPSYKAMLELVQNDKETKLTIGTEKLEIAKNEFCDEVIGEINTEWLTELTTNKKGEYETTIENVKLILLNDPNLKGKIAYNEFNFKLTALANLPWRKISRDNNTWEDIDDSGLRNYIEKVYNISHVGKTADAVAVVQELNKYHPVRDYLDSLEWDSAERLDNLFIDYLGAEDTEYTKAVTRKTFVAAVARIYQPGIKFDTMLVLNGPQGIGKSYILHKLGKGWYSDSFNTVVGKEAYEQLHGNWLMEMAELTAAKKSEVEAVKHFISKCEDTYRVAYGRRTSTFPRQCVFFGTTNDHEFLRDRTGNRRFLPIPCGVSKKLKSIWEDLTEAEIDQIWAEAKQRYKDKETLFLEGKLVEIAVQKQEEHSEQDVRLGLVKDFLDMKLPTDWETMDVWARRDYIEANVGKEDVEGLERKRVCAIEVWHELFNNAINTLNKIETRAINDMLNNMVGWEKTESSIRFGVYGKQRGYKRK
jgi:predicted P-loop ATPase